MGFGKVLVVGVDDGRFGDLVGNGAKKGAKKGAKNKLKIVFYNKLEGSVRSLKELAKLYAQNETGLENFRQTLDKEQFEYPQMKLLDMGFWQFGFDNITNNDE